MEFDPVNRDVPAPRYELESGSEDEFEQGDRPAAGTETREFFRIISAHDSSSSVTLQTDTQLVVLIGNAGAALLSSLQGSAPAELYSLRTETDQHASIAVVDSASSKITAALVAPPPHLRSSRFHDIAQTLVEAVQPSSIVIVDSYSPQEQLYRDPYSDDAEDRVDDTIRYLATPSYLEQNKVDARGLTPLRSPEAASGLGAAFLSKVSIGSLASHSLITMTMTLTPNLSYNCIRPWYLTFPQF